MDVDVLKAEEQKNETPRSFPFRFFSCYADMPFNIFKWLREIAAAHESMRGLFSRHATKPSLLHAVEMAGRLVDAGFMW